MTTTERPVTQLRAPDRLFIGGDWVSAATSERFDVVDPSTEAVIAQVAAAGNDDVARAVGAARAAFDHGPWPWLTPAERAAHLHALAAALEARREELALHWTSEMGIVHSLARL